MCYSTYRTKEESKSNLPKFQKSMKCVGAIEEAPAEFKGGTTYVNA